MLIVQQKSQSDAVRILVPMVTDGGRWSRRRNPVKPSMSPPADGIALKETTSVGPSASACPRLESLTVSCKEISGVLVCGIHHR